MVWIYDYAPAIALIPLASFLVALFLGPRLPKRGALSGIAATGMSLFLSLWALVHLAGPAEPYQQTLYTFVTGAGDEAVTLSFGVLIDPLSALMLVVVSLIAFLVFVFSLGYMNDEGETGLPRYYAGLSLFTFSMLAFVLADNLLMAFMFFELVGLCSFLLIGFWFREDAPPSAAKKAFLVTRFGDFFFLIGVVAVLATFGTAAFAGEESFVHMAELAVGDGETPGVVGEWLDQIGMSAQAWFTVVGLLILGGVIGKSAQFPLHTWLPDAMEGPTPVSALIHAATMVAAGVYLVARMYGFYALSPTAMAIIALIGGFTALFAATMGVVKQELKQVLAYSTISQYGYMMLALGTGGYVAAVFHLTTHAVFKGLLFLGAGSVIIAMHHNEDMWDMGGLKERMPVTYWTFLSGSLALAGILPFAGFWSKDEVLFEALIHGLTAPVLLVAWAMGLLAVFLTAFYTFRMVFLTFHGEPRTDAAENPHGVGWNVKFPLAVLGILAATVGFVNMAPVSRAAGLDIEFLHQWLEGTEVLNAEFFTGYEHYSTLVGEFAGFESTYVLGGEIPTLLLSAALSLGLALAGAGLAYRLYNVPEPVEHTQRLGNLRTLIMNNYYQDEYQVWLAERVTLPIANAANTFDQSAIDGAVNGVASVSLFLGERFRRIQTGVVTNYAALLTITFVVLLAFFAWTGGWI